MEFRVLGPIEVVEAGERRAISSGHQRTLLALLIINANRVLSSDRIIDSVWGDAPPASGTKALAFHLSRLRDALSPGRHAGAAACPLVSVTNGYVLHADRRDIDAARCEDLADAACALLTSDPTRARAMFTDALSMWRGEPLADVSDAPFAQTEIRRLEDLRRRIVVGRIEADLALGRHVSVVGELEGLVKDDPIDERLRGLLMLALYRSGRQADALHAFQDARRLLAEELGVEPSASLTQLEAQILAHDPALDAVAGATVRRNPFKGLRAFGESDQADFFGREALVARLVDRLGRVWQGSGLLLVTGPSGSGKSSVVQAGLVPAIRAGAIDGSDEWQIVTVRASGDLLDALGAALRRGGRSPSGRRVREGGAAGVARLLEAVATPDGPGLLLVIDQLEQVFDGAAGDEGCRVLDALASAFGRTRGRLAGVATLRADFLEQALRAPRFAELIRDGLEVVGPMTPDEIERAVVRPAARVGVTVERELVARVVADLEHRAGALPLLEFAMTGLFEHAGDSSILRCRDYLALGGAGGTLAREADEAWSSLDEQGRELAHQVLLRLTGVVERAGEIARRVPRAELRSLAGSETALDASLEPFGRRRLLVFGRDATTGESTVELAHEALLARWPRLAAWIEEARRDLHLCRRLGDAAAEWEGSGRKPGFLATGERLHVYEQWAATTHLRLTAAERGYLDASRRERIRAERAEAARAAQVSGLERRARTIRRVALAAVMAAIVGAGALAVVLGRDWALAAERQSIARADELAAASLASVGHERQLSLLLALEAAGATSTRGFVTEAAYDALQWAVQEAQAPYATQDGDRPVAVREAPDGPRGVVLVSPDELMRMAAARVHRRLTDDECRTYLHADRCAGVVVPPAGSVALLVRSGGNTVDAATLATGDLAGTTVRLVVDLPADLGPSLDAFTGRTGIGVTVAPGAADGLAQQVAAGEIPDLAIVSQPQSVHALAENGWLLDLTGRVDASGLRAAVGDDVLELMTMSSEGRWPAANGPLYGAPLAVSAEDVLWYSTTAFAASGRDPPDSWEAVLALSERLALEGATPWCIGAENGTATGSAAIAWIEDRYLDLWGIDAYDAWASGAVPFTDGTVVRAIGDFGSIALAPGYVVGGPIAIERIPESLASWPLFVEASPARCWLYRGSSRDEALFPAAAAGQSAAITFPPSADRAGPHAVLGRLYSVVAFRDRPEVRALLRELTSTGFADAIVPAMTSRGILPVLASATPESSAAFAAQATRVRRSLSEGTFRVRATDLLPAEVAAEFRRGVVRYLEFGAGELDDCLWPIEDARLALGLGSPPP